MFIRPEMASRSGGKPSVGEYCNARAPFSASTSVVTSAISDAGKVSISRQTAGKGDDLWALGQLEDFTNRGRP